MKKLLSIAVALAVTLSMLIAPAVGAVSDGTISVVVANPIALENSAYTVSFHNDGLLLGDDDQFIDVMFPLGTTLGSLISVTVTKGPSKATAITPVATTVFTVVGDKTVRIYLDAGQFIEKCNWVRIVLVDVTNPASCDYHLQVGTSVAGPFESSDYRIFSLKIELVEGKNLISLPAYPEDPAIEVVLAALFAAVANPLHDLTEFSVWYWDSWAEEWVIYASDTSFDDLTEMTAGKAYWIKVDADVTFMFKGVPYPKDQGPPQKWCYPECWSMIGIATTTDTLASAYLFDTMLPWPNQTTYAVSTIFGFNESTQQFFNTGWRPDTRDNLPFAAPYFDYTLEAGEGYFMSFLGESCIIPPVA